MVEPTAVNRVVVGSSPTRGANVSMSHTIKKQLLKNPVNKEAFVSKCLWDFFIEGVYNENSYNMWKYEIRERNAKYSIFIRSKT